MEETKKYFDNFYPQISTQEFMKLFPKKHQENNIRFIKCFYETIQETQKNTVSQEKKSFEKFIEELQCSQEITYEQIMKLVNKQNEKIEEELLITNNLIKGEINEIMGLLNAHNWEIL